MTHNSNFSYLIFKSPGGANKKIILSKERTTLGRAPHSDIFIDAPGVFPLHATIVRSLEDTFIISNNNDTAIIVNGIKTQRSSLLNNDIFVIENLEFTLIKPSPTIQIQNKDASILSAFNLIDLALDLSPLPQKNINPNEHEQIENHNQNSPHKTLITTPIKNFKKNITQTQSTSTNEAPLSVIPPNHLKNSFDEFNNNSHSANTHFIENLNNKDTIPLDTIAADTIAADTIASPHPNLTENNPVANKQTSPNNPNNATKIEGLWGSLKTINAEQKEIVYSFTEQLVVVSFDKSKILFSLRDDGAYITHLDGPEAFIGNVKCKETLKIHNQQNITICNTKFIFFTFNQK